MDDLSTFCCLNPACADHGKRGGGNIAVRARYGPYNRRLLYCKVCKARFSERQGTPLFDCRLPPDKALAVLAHLQDGCGIRQTERLTHVNRNTVMRLGRLAGSHAKAAHDELVAFSPLDDWPGRTLRKPIGPRRYQPRTPAMVAGLADHVWSLREWLAFPVC